jgi:site-specific DNA-cytosine methylase
MEGKAVNDDDSFEGGEAGGILYEIINDIEQIGYSVQAFVIPACAVNAPHRRDRIWVVAHAESVGIGGFGSQKRRIEQWQIQQKKQRSQTNT